jgi:hypothetical protein
MPAPAPFPSPSSAGRPAAPLESRGAVVRTGFSILGGLVLLAASVCVGIGGIGWAAAGNLERIMVVYKAQVETMERSGELTPEQQKRLQEAKRQLAEMEAAMNDPAQREKFEKLGEMRPYGYYEIIVALLGVIAGIAVLAATGFGKVSGMVVAVLGAISCLWALTLDQAPGVSVQMVFMGLYAVTFFGANSLRRELPTGNH